MSESPKAATNRQPRLRLAVGSLAVEAGATVTARIQLVIGGQPVQLDVTVPKGMCRLQDLLPVFQSLASLVARIGEQKAHEAGCVVSCRKGCGACCRQLVPLAVSEARAISELVGQMPEPRRSQVQARFAEASARLARVGLREAFRRPDVSVTERRQELGLSYFALGMPCPFLEEECCSIHPVRPTACREYLVTSAASHCARPSTETVHVVPLPAKVSRALMQLEAAAAGDGVGWVPLALALDPAEADVADVPCQPGPVWLEQFFRLWGIMRF
jgi:Fe-S-cluster containining protein